MSGPFNPREGTFGNYPAASKMAISLGHVGQLSGYLEGSLYWCSGQTQLYVDPNPGPWLFNTALKNALKSFQSFWGLPSTGVCDAATWGVIDYNNALHGRY